MQQEDVDVIGAQRFKALLKLFVDHPTIDLHPAGADVAAFAEYRDVVAAPSRFHPLSQRDLGTAIAARAVEGIDALGKHAVQQGCRRAVIG